MRAGRTGGKRRDAGCLYEHLFAAAYASSRTTAPGARNNQLLDTANLRPEKCNAANLGSATLPGQYRTTRREPGSETQQTKNLQLNSLKISLIRSPKSSQIPSNPGRLDHEPSQAHINSVKDRHLINIGAKIFGKYFKSP